jgi:single-stranded DNA-specific DHH superfamily exonuclease
VTDTHQFDDYSKYKSTLFDVEKKAKGREKEFLKDRKRVYGMGVALPEFEGSHLETKQCSCSVISGKD